MARGRPVEEETRARAVELAKQGLSRNAIARELGIGAATVTKIIAGAGLSFDRSETEQAVKARQIDLAAMRINLAEKMGTAASAMLDRIDDSYLVYNFGGKDNDYNEHVLDSAPVEVKRSIVVTAGIAFDKITRIVEKDNGGLEQAQGVLDQIAEGFKAAADKYRTEATDEPE
ncbi:helix-turn-helix domain-containing protein [Paramicrobacterium agarici]|uniref:helix-turn-helix domain-containing protein n=1 Tax=Paramicrobacterium agarici TaxID=630514 RepID=UPI0011693EA3|nr:helix-turn-helix domain-containing protein [Microbacterium agarici]TQO23796.1 Homeodomain-like domain-containing protein [Microbacterium agarici]